MGKNVLIITGSPREKGNSCTLAEAFRQGAEKSGNEVKVFDAHNRRIGFYSGPTLLCEDGDETAGELHQLLGWADVLVFATPVYFMGVTAGLKTVMDRLSPYEAPEGKKYFNPKESYRIATATAANPEMFEAVCLEFDYLMGKLGIKHTNKLLVGGVAGEGDVLDREDAMEKAILSGYSVGKIGGVY